MATTTPAYSWPVPTSSDLVKDGATAIEALGDAIDASMNTALGTNKAMGVLLTTVSFSGVSSQSINDVFSSTYDNYLIEYKNTTCSANSTLSLRYRLSGTDTSANYAQQRLYAQGTSVSANRDALGTDEIFVNDISSTDPATSSQTFIINSPNKAEHTILNGLGGTWFDGTTLYTGIICGIQRSTTQFTGFTLITSTGTFGGTVSVYGLNK
jgi:hypothetical protein